MNEQPTASESGEPGDEVILEGLRDLGRYVDETHYPGLAWTAAPRGQTIRLCVWSAASAAAAAAIVLAGMLLWQSGESAQPTAPQGTPRIAGKAPAPEPIDGKSRRTADPGQDGRAVATTDAATTTAGMDYNIPSVSYTNPNCDWNIPSVSFLGTSGTSSSKKTTPTTPPADRERSDAGQPTGASRGAA